MTDDLNAFIGARLDEDEAAARAANGLSWLVAEFTAEDALQEGDVSPEGLAWVMNEHMHMFDTDAPSAAHIARHDPARVLRDVAADRKLIAAYEGAAEFSDPWIGLDLAIRIRAERFSDHPDYCSEWRP